MFTDSSLSFNTNWSTAQTVTTTADSSTIVDITGAGSGNAPAMISGFPAANTAVANDYGAAGDGVAVPWVVVVVKVAGGANSNTLTISVSSAPDNGSYSPGSYTICGQTAALLDSTLAVGTIIAFPLPPRAPGAAMPRFYKLTYTASATLTPLQVQAGIVLNPPSFLTGTQYNSNFLVA
jgi:hypothetical protein